MIPFLATGATLAVTQGIDILARRGGLKPKHDLVTHKDTAVDAALAAVAIAPQLFNLAVPSPMLERFRPLSLDTLYRFYKARPFLQGVSIAALGTLALRQKLRNGEGHYLNLGLQASGGLRVLGNFVSPPVAFTPHDEGHFVVTKRELNRILKPEDKVLGLFLNGEARAYPLEIFRKPHLIHDTVGGLPVVPTYCELSNSAVAFRDDWSGERLDLQMIGSPNNNAVFYEGGSDGLVQQLEAAVGAGPNKGKQLQTFPLAITTWRHWRELHPATTGIWFDQGLKGGALDFVLKAVERYDRRQTEPLLAVSGGVDTRLRPKERVLAIRHRGEAIAYPRPYLREHPVLSLTLGGEPIVILYDVERDLAAAFFRRLDDQVLSFAEASHGDGVAEDAETGHLWDVTGCARAGRRIESCLRPVPFAVDKVYWFAWAHFYPETRLGAPGRARAPATQKSL